MFNKATGPGLSNNRSMYHVVKGKIPKGNENSLNAVPNLADTVEADNVRKLIDTQQADVGTYQKNIDNDPTMLAMAGTCVRRMPRMIYFYH